MKKRKVYPGEVHHVCQMTQGKVVIFYTAIDYLVFYTVFCTVAKRREISVLALSPMPDHIHHVNVVYGLKELSAFVAEYTRIFAGLWNKARGRKGDLFHHNFNSSVKLGNKQARTTIAYSYNNAVERKLVDLPEEYRWNLLAYVNDAHPFSAPLVRSKARRSLVQALKEVDLCYNQGKYLNYRMLSRIWKRLTLGEQQQLTDYIIGLWDIVDFKETIRYYGSYEAMVRAFHDNTGSDYDIKEDRDNYTDTVYADCTAVLLKQGAVGNPMEIPTLPDERKWELYKLLNYRTQARPKQLRKYLHLPLKDPSHGSA